MHVGQKVMLIAPLDHAANWVEHENPPVGSIGVITVGIDEYSEYEVCFEGYPHPAINDPDWIVHKNWIVPIDDCKKTVYEDATAFA